MTDWRTQYATSRIFSPAQRLELVAIPRTKAGLFDCSPLSTQDLAIIRERRGASNRLGLPYNSVLSDIPAMS